MDFDTFRPTKDRHYHSIPISYRAGAVSYSACAIDPDAGVDSSIASSPSRLSTYSQSVHSPASPTSRIPRSLHHDHPAQNIREKASIDAPRTQAQAADVETTVEKLRTELARVRQSTSIAELSMSRLTLSSMERELASKWASTQTIAMHASWHFTQLQGVYGKAFSDISKVASAAGRAGSHSSLNSIQSTLKSSIDPIAKEYESFIVSLESELDAIAITGTKRTTKAHGLPISMNVKRVPGSHFHPDRSNQKEEGVGSQTRGSEATAVASVTFAQASDLGLGGREAEAEAETRDAERLQDLAKALGLEKTRMSVDGKAGVPVELASEAQAGSQRISNYQELQINHATTVGELEQVRALYLSTLAELDEMTAQQEQAQRKLRRPSLASLSNSYAASGQGPAAVSSSPDFFSSRRSPIHTNTSTLVSQRSLRRDYSEIPKKASAEKEELLETINSDNYSEQARLQEEICQSQLSREGSVNRSIPNRKSTNVSSVVPFKRAYSNSRTPSLQPLNLPLMRSSSLSLSGFSALQGLMRSPSSPAFRRPPSVSGYSSPVALDITNDQQTPHNTQRSHESLEREVLQLQEVLKEREEEIRALELTIRQTPRLSESLASLNADSAGVNGFSHVSTSQIPQHTAAGGRDSTTSSASLAHANQVDNSSLFPTVPSTADVCQTPCVDSNRNRLAASDTSKSLHVLMRSMAKKETDFLEAIKKLKTQLESSERQHEALVKLSADQMLNMSSEIEALREKLKMSQAPDAESSRLEGYSAEKLREQALQDEQIRQAEIQALKADHESALAKLKMERSENFNQLFSFTNEKIMAKEEQLKQLEIHWQAKMKAELSAQADLIWAESDLQQSNLAKAQVKSFQSKSSRDRELFNREILKSSKSHADETATLKEEMESRLESAETDFAKRIQELELLHAQKVGQLTSSMTSTSSKTDPDESDTWHLEQNQILESRNQELENEKLYLISEHEMRLEQMKAEHAREVSELQVEHDEILLASLSQLDQRRTVKFQTQLKTTENKFLLQIDEIKLGYERQIAMLNSTETLVSQPQTQGKQSYPTFTRSGESSELPSGRNSPAGGAGPNSTIDSAVLEPRVLKQIEEQESGISKLTKQLSQCEGNLKTNIASIAQLEDALNDTERNLRKSRLQMNGLVQERDKMSIQNQRLQMELQRSNADMENLKHGIQQEKLHLEIRLNQEMAAKEATRKQLESRMLEIQKSSEGRRSRFKYVASYSFQFHIRQVREDKPAFGVQSLRGCF